MNPIPLWVRILVVCGCLLLAFAALQHWRTSLIGDGVKQGTDAEHARWVERDRQADEDAAKETQRRLDRQGDSNRETQSQLAAARADADRAAAAARGLRGALATATAAARRSCNPAAQSDVAPAGDPIGVLADVLSRADARAGVLADYADRARIAGFGCEREYDSLKGAKP